MGSPTAVSRSDDGADLCQRALIARRTAQTSCEQSKWLAESIERDSRGCVRGSYPAEPRSVRTIRAAVWDLAAAAGAGEQKLACIRLAVSEAVSNAVVHAYPQGQGSIHVLARLLGQQLAVAIADDGCGPQVPSATPGLGCGRRLIASSSDCFTTRQRANGGTRVEMRWAM